MRRTFISRGLDVSGSRSMIVDVSEEKGGVKDLDRGARLIN